MSQTFTFYTTNNFSKRKNSTKRPYYYVTDPKIPCEFKGPYDMENPTIILQSLAYSSMDSYLLYNYCSTTIDSMTVYYYITDKRLLQGQGIIEMKLQLDYLATFKTYLLAPGQQKHVIRCSNTVYGGYVIPDPMLNQTAETVFNNLSLASAIFGANYSTGTWTAVVHLVANPGSSTTIYLPTEHTLLMNYANLTEYVNTIAGIGDDASFTETIKKAIMEYVESYSSLTLGVTLIPFNLSTGANQLFLFGVATDVYYDKITYGNAYYTNTVTLSLSWLYGDWRDYNNTINIYLPFIGWHTIDTALLYGYDKCMVKVNVNYLDGHITYEIRPGSSWNTAPTIARLETDCGINMSVNVTDMTSSKLGLLSQTISSLSNVMGKIGESPLSMISQGVEEYGKIASAMKIDTIKGGLGQNLASWEMWEPNIRIQMFNKNYTNSPTDINGMYGHPVDYYSNGDMTSFSGYIQMQDYDFTAKLVTMSVRDAINNLMNGGIYYE